MRIAIIDYGAGNIQSIQFALQRIGYQGILTNDWNEIKSADKVLFPGVGEAGSAMKKLNESGLDKYIPTLKVPVLGICLGMQLMCRFSYEGNTKALGIFDNDVVRFSDRVKVPHMGWNQIYDLKSPLFTGVTENDYVYMVHSFYVPLCEEAIATTDYDVAYASALQRDNFYGVQFHPEKSGKTGELILSNFLKID